MSLYDVARTSNNLYMFLEYCHDGDLKEYLKKKEGKMNKKTKIFQVIDIGFFYIVILRFLNLKKAKNLK